MVIALAKFTGWGMHDLLELTEPDLTMWFQAALDHKAASEA